MAIDEICNRNNCMEVVAKEPCMLCEAMYQQGRADENKRVVEILHNFYEVRNPEQNAFMDRLVMEVMREQLKEHKNG